ncbi:hypothetical protein EKO27_g10313 [Xylaria grammica]|uniref:Uncharacterized protein n=1 Tax=Xylaria grammica TaxID=363999 RepID=A0A439CRJ3_9PEZI|nr:hypothetical protein EKO27_g10313 [Xylaria grammica]
MTAQRTLLLAPPSIASHEETLHNVYATFNRATSDLTMLDRLSSGLVALPPSTYDLVVVLTDAAGARRDEATQILTRRVYDAVAGSDEARRHPAPTRRPLTTRGRGHPRRSGVEGGRHIREGRGGGARATTLGVPIAKKQPVVSLLLDDDLDGFEDDDLIDEDTLLTEEDINRTIQPPAECIPKIGKRRRACKDCTCGLAAKLEADDRARRAKADAGLEVLKLGADDLDDLELDFTVKGKVGSCGSCSLGDAFRCADCPYLGLPAFKPGEEVTILNNVAQL